MFDRWDQVDTDFRVFYRIDGIGDGYIPCDLSGPRFIRMCEQLLFYDGAVRRWYELQALNHDHHDDHHVLQRGARSTMNVHNTVVSAEAAIHHPGFAGDAVIGVPAVISGRVAHN